MKNKFINTGYQPRTLQAHLHQNVKRFNVIVCHRRFGKTVWLINEMIDRAMNNKKKKPQYAYIAPTYGQAKRVAWEMLKEYTNCFPGRKTYEQELRVDIPRGDGDFIRFMLLGAENPDSLKGIYLDGAGLDEFACMYKSVWTEVIRPTLSDRLGWACFVGTPKGSNHFKELYDESTDKGNWFRILYKASETGVIPDSELEDAKRDMDDSTYLQEYECDFGAALIGAYYGKEMRAARTESRITRVPYDKGGFVYTAWDLGMDDSTAIWFLQEIGREIRVLKYIEDQGKDLQFYANIIKQQPYRYEEHFLPHDANVRELGTGVSRVDTLRKYNIGRITVVSKLPPADGVHASRMILPKCYFDEVQTSYGVKCLENYQRAWDSKKKIFVDKALHDWSSHGADAFRTFAVGFRGGRDRMDLNKLPREAKNDYDIFA